MSVKCKPLILAKSALTEEQLNVKERIGCDGIEVQLLNEMVQDRIRGTYLNPEDIYDLDALLKYDVRVVHAPLLSGTGDVTLEVMCDDKDISLLNNIFFIAECFGKHYNRKTVIVVHSESYYEVLTDLNDSWNHIVKALRWLLARYPHTELVIENVSPLRGIGKGKELHLANNFGFDNIDMVQHLMAELNTDRIGTCLDTCHAMLTKKYLNALYAEVGDVYPVNFSMDMFFQKNAPYLKLIHLCDIQGSGYGKGRHGIPFKPETYEKLSGILDLYNKYDCKCPITLEVEETDFSVCDGYHGTRDLVLHYFDESFIPEDFFDWCDAFAPESYKHMPNIEKWNFLKKCYLSSKEDL